MFALEDNQYSEDPYLAAKPRFAYAMPVQVVVLGMTVTLLAVLLVHLLFTLRYHLPLSRSNYSCQTVAVLFSVLRTAVELRIVMTTLALRPQEWPYMFDYIEVAVPPESWDTSVNAAWLTLLAVSQLAVHVTHIQFLTLLFPSALEARLILALLGPLALVSSLLYYTEFSDKAAVDDLGDAIRNTANSTLTLLYTLAILIWGFTINRKRAWRSEGGTATFGVFALVLGVSGTAINFVEVKEDRMRWLPGVISCILLWQSWVGFWWWVGAGMWTGEVEDVQRKEEKRRRREEIKKAKRERKAAASSAALLAGTGSDIGLRAIASTSSRRRRPVVPAPPIEEIELRSMGGAVAGAPGLVDLAPSVSSGSTPPPVPSRLDPLFALFRPFIARLRVAHNDAALKKAAEPRTVSEGWGLRQLGLRGRRERGERRADRGEDFDSEDRRAGFEQDGATQLEEWEDEAGDEDDEDGSGSETETSSTESSRDRERNGAAAASPAPAAAVADATPGRWTQRGWVARWRVRDRQEFP